MSGEQFLEKEVDLKKEEEGQKDYEEKLEDIKKNNENISSNISENFEK
jgi:hypothetical protein